MGSNAATMEIDVVHPRRNEPVETITRKPREVGPDDVRVKYSGREFRVFTKKGRNVIYGNRPLGSEYRPRETSESD